MYRGTTGKEHLGEPRSALEDPCQSGLRFPVGTPVRCFVGDNNWLGGTVVAQNYREAGWPEDRPSAPYTLPGRTQWAHCFLHSRASAGQPQANHGPQAMRSWLGESSAARPGASPRSRCRLGECCRETRSPCNAGTRVSRNDEEYVCGT